MKLNFRTLAAVTVVGIAFALGLAPNAQATLINPGEANVAATTSPFTSGSLVAGIGVGSAFTTSIGINGTYGQSVYAVNSFSPTTSTLDFYYRFTITSGLVNQSSVVNFANTSVYATDVTYLDAAQSAAAFAQTGDSIFNLSGLTLVAPQQFSRSVDGNSVGADYNPAGVTPGETTLVVRVRTNATAFTTGGFLGTVGNVIAAGPTFQPSGAMVPVVPVPEPTGALFGLLTLGAAFFYRKSPSATALAA